MKSSLLPVCVAVMAIATSEMSTVGIAQAQQWTKTPPIFNIPANSIQIPRNIKILPSVSGNLELVPGQYGYQVQCQNVKVYLISEEYIEEPPTQTPPGGVDLGLSKKPIFKYQGIVKPDNNKDNSGSTTYCKYSVSPDPQSVEKKAFLVFDTLTVCPEPKKLVTILNTNVKVNFKEVVCGIG
ncbi:MAG TPA: hypothetical protein V6D15_24530 [Oculatellaceae cyanobacterium]|jgi:hypothetical protein